MQAGKLNRRITVQQFNQASDGMGGMADPNNDTSWSNVMTVWASIESLNTRTYSREVFQAQQVVENLTHKITVRYQKGILPSMRVNYNSRIFNIRYVIDMNEAHVQLELLCEELKAG